MVSANNSTKVSVANIDQGTTDVTRSVWCKLHELTGKYSEVVDICGVQSWEVYFVQYEISGSWPKHVTFVKPMLGSLYSLTSRL